MIKAGPGCRVFPSKWSDEILCDICTNFRFFKWLVTIMCRTVHVQEIKMKEQKCGMSAHMHFFIDLTESPFTTESRPLQTSSCMFPCPSLNIHTHLLTMLSLIVFLPCTSQNCTMNLTKMYVPDIQKMNYRTNFTIGGLID